LFSEEEEALQTAGSIEQARQLGPAFRETGDVRGDLALKKAFAVTSRDADDHPAGKVRDTTVEVDRIRR
jgi:hypothetical protein